MYKASAPRQSSFDDFNQSCGMRLDPANDWCRLASRIPWRNWEARYAALFPSRRGRPAIPLRIALGALLVQKRLGLGDRPLPRQAAIPPAAPDLPMSGKMPSSAAGRHESEKAPAMHAFLGPDDDTKGGAACGYHPTWLSVSS